MENRDRILEAAARVYTRLGIRGATTRLIAHEAGVNEVTLFRTFGSKAALFEELLRCRSEEAHRAPLPAVPADPEQELVAWCAEQLRAMSENRAFVRKTLGEIAERPELVDVIAQGPCSTQGHLEDYVAELALQGRVDGVEDDEVRAATSMLMGALFADTVGRDMMPALFPPTHDEAARLYIRAFLRAIGVAPAPRST